MTEVVSNLQIVEERTNVNTKDIQILAKRIEQKEKQVAGDCKDRSENHHRRADDLDKALSKMDEKFEQRGDMKLRWGLGISIMLTLSLFGTVVGIMTTVKDAVEKQSKQSYYLQKKVEEIATTIEVVHARK